MEFGEKVFAFFLFEGEFSDELKVLEILFECLFRE